MPALKVFKDIFLLKIPLTFKDIFALKILVTFYKMFNSQKIIMQRKKIKLYIKEFNEKINYWFYVIFFGITYAFYENYNKYN